MAMRAASQRWFRFVDQLVSCASLNLRLEEILLQLSNLIFRTE